MKTHLAKESDLPGIGQNKLATMPISNRFNQHGLLLEFTKAAGATMSKAEILTDVDHISLTMKQRGKSSQVRLLKEIPADVIFDVLNIYPEQSKSSYTYAGCIYIPFTRDRLGMLVDPNALVIGMLDIEHYMINVKFKDVVLTTVLVGVIPEIDRGPKRPLGEHIRLGKWERSHTVISVENVTELPFGEPNTAMLGYHVDLGATGVLDDVEVRFNEELLHDPLTIAQNNLLLHRAGRTPVSGLFHVDFNRKGSALPVGVATSFRQKFNWSTAPNAYEVYTEMVHNLGDANY